MMHPLTWFGHWQTWLLLAGAWLALGLVYALLFGVIARIGREDEHHAA